MLEHVTAFIQILANCQGFWWVWINLFENAFMLTKEDKCGVCASELNNCTVLSTSAPNWPNCYLIRKHQFNKAFTSAADVLDSHCCNKEHHDRCSIMLLNGFWDWLDQWHALEQQVTSDQPYQASVLAQAAWPVPSRSGSWGFWLQEGDHWAVSSRTQTWLLGAAVWSPVPWLGRSGGTLDPPGLKTQEAI